MSERDEILFVIDIPPRSLPMARLAEYVSELAAMARLVSEEVGPVIEADSIDGEIIQIGGRDETISVYIREGHEAPIICTTTREKGRRLALLIFQQVRVYGQATWIRANNRWKRIHFVIDTWSELRPDSLGDVIQALRAVPTPNIDEIDALTVISGLRGDNDT